MKKYNYTNKGFTLIELLVVIAIISLLSSVIFASVTIARAKGNDARKLVEVNQVKSALQTYYLDHNAMPLTYTCTDTCIADSSRSTLEIEDTANPHNPTTESGKAYNRSMQDLVDAGLMTAIPHSPNPQTPYVYFDYGAGSVPGALFATSLEAAAPTSDGYPDTCRPWAGGGLVLSTICVATVFPDHRPNCFTYYRDGSMCSFDSATQSGLCPPSDLTAERGNLCSTSLNTDYCSCNPY